MQRTWRFLVLMGSIAQVALSADVEVIAMTQAPGYTNLRNCVQPCFQFPNGNWNIFGGLSCANNMCLCRDDLTSVAHDLVSTCIVTHNCQTSNAVDISMGLSFYDSYCSAYSVRLAGGPDTVTVTEAPNSDATAAPGSTVTVYVTRSSASSLSRTASEFASCSHIGLALLVSLMATFV